MPHITKADTEKRWVPLPPLAEQRRIVAKLEELLEPLSRVQERLGNLTHDFPEKFKAAVLQKAIQGKLVPQRDDEPAVEQLGEAPKVAPFEIPAKWKWCKIGTCIEIAPKIEAPSDLPVSFIPMTDLAAGFVNSIQKNQVKTWGVAKKGFSRFKNNDVLLAKITPCFQNRKSAVAEKLTNGIGTGSTEFLVLRSKNFDPKFLLGFLKSSFFIHYGIQNLKGTAGQQRLSTPALKQCPIPLPPLAEQHRIVAKVEQLFSQVDELTARLSS